MPSKPIPKRPHVVWVISDQIKADLDQLDTHIRRCTPCIVAHSLAPHAPLCASGSALAMMLARHWQTWRPDLHSQPSLFGGE